MGEPVVATPGRRASLISFNRVLRCFMQARAFFSPASASPGVSKQTGWWLGEGGSWKVVCTRAVRVILVGLFRSVPQATKRLHSTPISVVERKIKGVGGMQQAGSVQNASPLEVTGSTGRLQFVTFDIATVVCRRCGGKNWERSKTQKNKKKKNLKQRLRKEFCGPLQRAGPLGCRSRERFAVAK